MMGWSAPYTSPEAILKRRWFEICPAAPETATTIGVFHPADLAATSFEMS